MIRKILSNKQKEIKATDSLKDISENDYLTKEEKSAWKTIALVLVCALIITTAGWFIVSINGSKIPECFTKKIVADIIKDIRSVPLDPVVARNNLQEAYSFATWKFKRELDKMVRETNFTEKLRNNVTVTVLPESIRSESNGNIIIMTWIETQYRNSKIESENRYTGYAWIKYLPVKDEKVKLELNPFGIYINKLTIKENTDNE